MSEASFASLNPALLARKGGAKPAMRPQIAPLPQDPAAIAAIAEDQLEDLGWNDMGSESGQDENESAEVVSISSKAANEDALEAASPVVRRQQKDLSTRILAGAAMDLAEDEDDAEEVEDFVAETVKKAKKARNASRAKASVKSGKRAAFTLRLDADRHLKLRLASTMKGISAQALVTEALDAMLEKFEELDALAERMKRN